MSPSATVTAVLRVNCPSLPISHIHLSRHFGKDHPIGKTSELSDTPSQCFIFQRLKTSFTRFMSGLRGLFVWKQKATTDAPGTYSA